MIVVAKDTLLNPAVLETRSLPKRFFGRVMVLPRRGAGLGTYLRLAFEAQPLRFLLSLAPFLAPMLFWRDLAGPISQAPLAMLVVIAFVELKVLRLSDTARARLVSEDEAARRLDLLRFRALACLREIAARQGLSSGDLQLVVEQSELARIAPLTLVSVQTALPGPRLLDLDRAEQRILREGLFDGELTERDLHRVNQAQNTFLREIRLDTRGVSAHARLAAWIDREGAPDAAAEGA